MPLAAAAHVLITGASRGVGAATARAFATHGARVTLVARDSPQLTALAEEIGGRALPVDLGDATQIDGLIDRAESEAGALDVLVNNAAGCPLGVVADTGSAEVRHTIAVNLTAPIELTRQSLAGMLARRSGTVVNICSLGGISALPALTVYGATKAGLGLFTSGLQRELAGSGVTATVVLLGEISDTGMIEVAHSAPAFADASRRLRRLGALPHLTPDVVAARIVDGVRRQRATVVIPRRVGGLEAIRTLPMRLSDLVFTGIERPKPSASRPS